ncbi:DUF3021 domain-containing protein [Streptococcus oricebi]|uniref:DUF3021 domain-containing protein n=2 Tax=Streptococcus oricebi TaxID=1547447 RepID=A0ABS5B2D4_9STRE|nr:DUF3021 domain-containing protein [Streptococcus oricebi]
MKKIILGMIEGLRIGAFIYLLVIALEIQQSPPSAKNIYSVLVFSALIGLVTQLVFERDALSKLQSLILHCILTAILLSATMIYNDWLSQLIKPIFWLEYILIYLFTCLYFILDGYLKTQKINQALDKRRARKKETSKKV